MTKISSENSRWKGYTLEEIQQLRLENQADIDAQKRVLLSRFDFISSFRAKNKEIVGNVMSFVGYLDYISLGITLIKKLRPLFSRKKK
ncbi:MAG: hypothetical protein J1F20_00660 [Muribaculaceae bacterium]|nr:hypothetical protein [Muribaculaceae bacterium]